MILLTTSRRPTRAIRTLCSDLAYSLPSVVRVNRGKMSLDGIAEKSIELEADRTVIVNRWSGGLGRITLFKLTPTGLKPIPPIMLIAEACFRREFKEKTRRFQSSVITIDPEDSSELQRIGDCLSRFFHLPVVCVKEATRKHGASMHLSFGSKKHPQISFILRGGMIEIGPRITLSKLVWEIY